MKRIRNQPQAVGPDAVKQLHKSEGKVQHQKEQDVSGILVGQNEAQGPQESVVNP